MAQQAPVAADPLTPLAPSAPTSLTPETLTDAMISGRVQAALLTDPAMAGADVSVNTDRGVVSLTGTVKTHEQAGVASAHAQRQDGVMRVDSHISTNPQ